MRSGIDLLCSYRLAKVAPAECTGCFSMACCGWPELLHDQRIIDTCLGLGSRAALVSASRRIT